MWNRWTGRSIIGPPELIPTGTDRPYDSVAGGDEARTAVDAWVALPCHVSPSEAIQAGIRRDPERPLAVDQQIVRRTSREAVLEPNALEGRIRNRRRIAGRVHEPSARDALAEKPDTAVAVDGHRVLV